MIWTWAAFSILSRLSKPEGMQDKEGTGLLFFLFLDPSNSNLNTSGEQRILEIKENLRNTNIVDFAVLPDTCAHAHCFHNGRKILQYPLPTTKRFNSVLKSFAILHNHNSLLPNCQKKVIICKKLGPFARTCNPSKWEADI